MLDREIWQKKCGNILEPISRLVWSILPERGSNGWFIVEENAPDPIISNNLVDKFQWSFVPSLVDPNVSEAYKGGYSGKIVGLVGRRIIKRGLFSHKYLYDWSNLDIVSIKENKDRLGVPDTYGDIGYSLYSKDGLMFQVSFHEIDYSTLIKVTRQFPLEEYGEGIQRLVKSYSGLTKNLSFVIVEKETNTKVRKIPIKLEHIEPKDDGIKICLKCNTRWRGGHSCPKCGSKHFLVESTSPLDNAIFWKIV